VVVAIGRLPLLLGLLLVPTMMMLLIPPDPPEPAARATLR